MKKYFILLWIILLMPYSLLSNKKNDYSTKDAFIESVNKNRQYILNMINDSLISHKEIIPTYHNLFKEEISTGTKTKKYKILSSIGFIAKSISTLNNIKYVELNKHQGFKSIFIEDEKLFRICIIAFKDNDFRIKYKAREILIKYGREDYLARYSDEIKKLIPKYYEAEVESQIRKLKKSLEKNPSINEKEMIEDNIKSYERLLKENYNKIENSVKFDKLYLLLPKSQKEKKYLLDTININAIEYRARLGDKKAERKLIKNFKSTNDFRKKQALAKRLGIAGTPACAEALIGDLYSPLSHKKRTNITNAVGLGYPTIRVSIIEALLRMNPEAEFKYDFCFVTECPVDENRIEIYRGREKVMELFKKIVTWAEKKYKVKPKGTTPDISLIF